MRSSSNWSEVPSALVGNRRTWVPHSAARATLVLTALLAWAPAVAESPIQLRDVTRNAGITFRHTDGGSGKRYLIEAMSAGLALFDYDGDGDVDVYLLNGAPLPGTQVDVPPKNALYRNDGGFRFTDVTDQAGVGDTGYGLGVAVGDFDNDGWPDLYLNNYGPNVFYRNSGDGTFTEVARPSGTDNGHKVGAGACFLDMDQDGDLDLYVANYIKFSFQAPYPRTLLGHVVYPGPMVFPPEPDDLFRNNGDGTFTNVSKQAGVAAHAEWGMGTICADFDDDGDTDIFVANDSTRNLYFENDGTGTFEETALLAGVAYDLNGDAQGSMGVECADYNNDGRLDLYNTTYQRQLTTLYMNLGAGIFQDVSLRTGAAAGTFQHVNWGTGLIDFDNDGDRDLFIANGHIHDNVDRFDDSTSYLIKNQLMLNTGRGRFVDVSAESGNGMMPKLSSRGAAFDDLDNDGDIDVVVLNSRRECTILRNDSHNDNHWLQLRLRGVKTNRDGVGARVKIVAGDLTQVDEVHSGRGYQSHYGSRLHFGFGERQRIDRIEIHWIGGGTDIIEDVPVDRILTLREGHGD